MKSNTKIIKVLPCLVLSAILVVLLSTFPNIVYASVFPDDSATYYIGSTGDTVSLIQDQMVIYGYLEEGSYTAGTYDEATADAVSVFQLYNGYDRPDGMFGNWSRGVFRNGSPVEYHSLTKGENGRIPRLVQEKLHEAGYLTVSPDGWWGNFSANAVKLLNFYYSEGTDRDDDVLSAAVLGSLLNSDKLYINDVSGKFYQGDSSETIAKIRLRLYQAGFADLSYSTEFDDDLRTSVCIYQMFGGINFDGIIGNWTCTRLNSGEIYYYRATFGEKSDTVLGLQKALSKIGLLTVYPDGIYGNYTYSAINAFRNEIGMQGGYSTIYFEDWTALAKYRDIFNTVNVDTSALPLKCGSTGNDVKTVQENLKSFGYLKAEPDGVFGNKTKTAVLLFQANNGFETNGELALDQVIILLGDGDNVVGYSDISEGSTGDEVLLLQKILYGTGWLYADPDGIFGTETLSAVNSFRKANERPDNNAFILDDWNSLIDMESRFDGMYFDISKPLKMGSTGDAVRAMQSRLVELGYGNFTPDEIFGNKSISALKLFQVNNSLTQDGTCDSDDMRLLASLSPASLYEKVSAGYVYGTESYLNVRSGAGTSYSVVGTLKDYCYLIINDSKVLSNGVRWLNISNSDSTLTGWVSSEYVKIFSDSSFVMLLIKRGFPVSYVPYLYELHERYPNWEFRVNDTQLDWSQVINRETAYIGTNLIQKSYSWGVRAGQENNVMDSGGYVPASVDAVKYYMDPRNFLTYKSIFQFLSQRYDSDFDYSVPLENLIDGTFLDADLPEEEDGCKTYADVIIAAGEAYGMSPMEIASMILAEQGTNPSSPSSVSGDYPGHRGLYNFFNYGAVKSDTGSAVANGLKFAERHGWTSPKKAIFGGTEMTVDGYIDNNQYTFYLQKFNVMNGQSKVASHQYMTDVMGANTKGVVSYEGYEAIISDAFVFYIPVYGSMPGEAVPHP